MHFKPKKVPLLILAIVSLVCSRGFFFWVNDPEGPNLVVVLGLAAIIFIAGLALYALASYFSGAAESQ